MKRLYSGRKRWTLCLALCAVVAGAFCIHRKRHMVEEE